MSEQEIYLQSQMTCALIEVAAMNAENQNRIHIGEALAYTEKAFMELIDKYSLGCNSVLFYLRGY